ncbi:MAG: CoA-binding protein [Zoogloeaceae bacterium]|jgi:predicted CoA-binding protein|nr:CoA-binding protein [Zoogloeaceae bacterium]
MLKTDAEIRQVLQSAKTIAIVGASPKADRPSNVVAGYLKAQGYTVIPVNPTADEIVGEKCYASLKEVPVPIDIVDVFRKPEDAPGVAEEAVAVKAKALWLQLEVISPEAVAIAERAGLQTVMDRCTEIEHMRLF